MSAFERSISAVPSSTMRPFSITYPCSAIVSASVAFCSTSRTVSFSWRLRRWTMAKISSTSMGASPIDALTAQLDRALGHLAALGAKQARDGLERRRLPRPVGAEQGSDAALADVERHALEDEDDAVVDDFDVVQRQHRIRSRRGPKP